MRIRIAADCNVCTDEHSNAYQSIGRGPAPEITIPSFRARLSISEAARLAADLTRAVAVAKREQAIARCKAEILRDIASGRVPATVTSFTQLHDYVDANGYGGAFETCPILKDDESNIDECHADTDFWNEVHAEINQWLATRAVEEKPLPPKQFKRLLNRVKTGEIKLSDIEVPPPTRKDSK